MNTTPNQAAQEAIERKLTHLIANHPDIADAFQELGIAANTTTDLSPAEAKFRQVLISKGVPEDEIPGLNRVALRSVMHDQWETLRQGADKPTIEI